MKSLVMKQMSYMSTAGYMCSSVCITESCGSLLRRQCSAVSILLPAVLSLLAPIPTWSALFLMYHKTKKPNCTHLYLPHAPPKSTPTPTFLAPSNVKNPLSGLPWWSRIYKSTLQSRESRFNPWLGS